jgi:single-strand DNA-binding protein
MAVITVTGNVGTEPALKFYEGKNGSFGVASFSLGYTPSEKKGAEWTQGETMWFRVSVLGKQAEVIADAVRKGDKVLVIGAFKQSSYKAKDGTQKTGFEIKADSVTLVPKAGTLMPKEPSASKENYWGDNPWN